MSGKPIISVLGATGLQGGSVVKFILDDPAKSFRVRAITRNVNSDSAKKLALLPGVEVVQADLNDVESLRRAFAGAYGVFGVTNYWEKCDEALEIRQGRNLVDAARDTGVKHFIWSTLDHTNNPEVVHWNTKATVDDYLKESGVPRTSLYTSFYYENFESLVSFANPPFLWNDGPIGGYAVADTGAYVLEAFKKPDEWIGKDLRVCADIFTPRQVVEIVKKLSGQNVAPKELSYEGFEKLKQPPYEELWTNMKLFYNADGNPGRDIALTKKIYPKRKTIRTYIEDNLERLVKDMIASTA